MAIHAVVPAGALRLQGRREALAAGSAGWSTRPGTLYHRARAQARRAARGAPGGRGAARRRDRGGVSRGHDRRRPRRCCRSTPTCCRRRSRPRRRCSRSRCASPTRSTRSATAVEFVGATTPAARACGASACGDGRAASRLAFLPPRATAQRRPARARRRSCARDIGRRARASAVERLARPCPGSRPPRPPCAAASASPR